MSKLTESVVEEAALQWLGELGYGTLFGPEIAPEEPAAERSTFDQAIPVRSEESMPEARPSRANQDRGAPSAVRK